MKTLTPKQEKFAELYVELGNASEAYRRSYDVRPNTKQTSINEKASQLLNKVAIRSRVEQLREELRESNKVTKDWIIQKHKDLIEWYEELKELSRRKDLTKEEKSRVYMLKDLIKGSDFRGSLDSLTKMLGYNEPDKTEHTIKTVDINIKRNRD